MQLTWIPSMRQFVGTQTEAKKLRLDFEVEDIPTDKQGLMDYINGIHTHYLAQLVERDAETMLTVELTAPPVVTLPPATPEIEAAIEKAIMKPSPLTVMQRDVAEEIMDADGPTFGRYLSATLERLGELRGAGWDQLRQFVGRNPRSRTSLERGIGYLILEAPQMVRSDTAAD